MIAYALCDANGDVIAFVNAPEAPTAPDGGSILVIDAVPASGRWSASNGALVAYVPSLAQNQASKAQAATAVYASRIAAGFTWSSVLYQIDPASQANISAMGLMALGSVTDPANSPWPSGFYWVAADNSHVAMDAPAMYAFGRAVGAYVSACVLKLRAIKDAIAAAADQATLDAIDVTAGYPAASA
jgi:hypothetical protein